MILSGHSAVTYLLGMGEMYGTKERIGYVLVEGNHDQLLFKKLVAETNGNNRIWCLPVSGKSAVIEVTTEMHSKGYSCGLGIVDSDYDDGVVYPEGVIPLESNNIESMLLSSGAFVLAIGSLCPEFNLENGDDLLDFIKSNGEQMAFIRAFNHRLPENQSFSLKHLTLAVSEQGFDPKKFAEIGLAKPNPRGMRHLETIRDGNDDWKIELKDFDSYCWRWINGKDGLRLAIVFIKKQCADSKLSDEKFVESMIESYLPTHFLTQKNMIASINKHQQTHNVVLFTPSATIG
jgi:hypothetical protein